MSTRNAPALTATVGDFDRTRPLLDGRVGVEGFEIEWQSGELESIFSRAFETAEPDITELSFCNFLIATARGNCPYVGLPIFPVRCFRHHALFIRSDRGISKPRDLEGRRIGLREYTNTAALVVKGVLQSYYGVDLTRIRWVVGDIDQRERTEIPVPQLPTPYEIRAESDALLSDMLETGELDGLIAYSPPRCYGRSGVTRLFPRWWEEERRYFQDTKVFPIMHLIVLRRSLAERYPELARSVFDAFCEAKSLALRELAIEQAPRTMLPWAPAHLLQTREIMGEDFWPYGVAANRRTLDAQLEFARNQNLVSRPVGLEELFVSSLLHVQKSQ